MTILIATEDATDRLLLQLMLRRHRHEAHAIADGEELLLASKQRDPDVVIMDMQTPVFNGGEAAHAIVQSRGERAKPVIVGLTTVIRERDRQSALEGLADAFLHKPLDESALRKLLDHMRRQVQTSRNLGPKSLDALTESPSLLAESISEYLFGADVLAVELQDEMVLYDQPALVSLTSRLAHLSARYGMNDFAALCDELVVMAKAGEGPGAGELRSAVVRAYQQMRLERLRHRSRLLKTAQQEFAHLRPSPYSANMRGVL